MESLIKTGNVDPKRATVKLAIIFTAIPDTSSGTVTATLASIAAVMPDVSPTLIQMIVSVPSICTAFIAVLYAFGSFRIRIRTMLKLGCFFFFAGGLGPVFCNSIIPILFFRAMVGVASGIMMPLTVDIICNLYQNREQKSMLGYASMLTYFGAISFQTVGGFLGNIDWHYSFCACLIAAPFFIFSLIYMPEPPQKKQNPNDAYTTGENRNKAKKVTVSKYSSLTIVFTYFRDMLFFIFLANASMVMVGEHLTNTAQAGITISMFSIGALIVDFFYEKIDRYTKRYTLPLSYVLIMLGLLIFQLSYSYIFFNVAGFLAGVGYGLSGPATFSTISHTSHNVKSRTLGISLTYVALGAGGFSSPLVVALLHNITGTELGRTTFKMGWIGMLVLSMLVLVFMTRVYPTRPKPDNDTSAST